MGFSNLRRALVLTSFAIQYFARSLIIQNDIQMQNSDIYKHVASNVPFDPTHLIMKILLLAGYIAFL